MDFLLDKKPKFCNGKVAFDKTEYYLEMVNGNGALLRVSENGIPREELILTKTDMKALFLLLTA